MEFIIKSIILILISDIIQTLNCLPENSDIFIPTSSVKSLATSTSALNKLNNSNNILNFTGKPDYENYVNDNEYEVNNDRDDDIPLEQWNEDSNENIFNNALDTRTKIAFSFLGLFLANGAFAASIPPVLLFCVTDPTLVICGGTLLVFGITATVAILYDLAFAYEIRDTPEIFNITDYNSEDSNYFTSVEFSTKLIENYAKNLLPDQYVNIGNVQFYNSKNLLIAKDIDYGSQEVSYISFDFNIFYKIKKIRDFTKRVKGFFKMSMALYLPDKNGKIGAVVLFKKNVDRNIKVFDKTLNIIVGNNEGLKFEIVADYRKIKELNITQILQNYFKNLIKNRGKTINVKHELYGFSLNIMGVNRDQFGFSNNLVSY
ncbi:uncharacterized protein ASCRUDRAFT_68917 [Ascoidea rubescens DSM 1968]|uniref:SMP-LTD domain-containing protein n=1 Tax=Ascoidea rubescens DSM 1968 TaxID=1344418 RepID=A0A1D2VNG8_9ASCO|nr:hypothetical protein ASCRUDRAFT_68917 [Ascoidea rubescens DSM 1968]ODV63150.1 hypothetical protein ASCRUDRAFT_68917 [Ascoidea rubescens DSM 1968]